MKRKKGYIDRSETFDEFLARDGLLAELEQAALKEIAADRKGYVDVGRAERTDPAAG